MADGPADRYRSAVERLGSAQKTPVGVAAYLRWVNRPIGGRIAAIGYALNATPNHLTAISATCSFGAIGAIALCAPTPATSVAIAVVLLVGYAFDSADGQLSRVRGGGSPAGEWLDHVVDIAKTAALHSAVAVSLVRFPVDGTESWALVALGFGVVHVTFFFAMMLRDQLGGRPPKAGPGATASAAKAFALLPMDYGLLCLILGARFADVPFLVAYGGLAAFTAAFSLRSLPKAHRVLGA